MYILCICVEDEKVLVKTFGNIIYFCETCTGKGPVGSHSDNIDMIYGQPRSSDKEKINEFLARKFFHNEVEITQRE